MPSRENKQPQPQRQPPVTAPDRADESEPPVSDFLADEIGALDSMRRRKPGKGGTAPDKGAPGANAPATGAPTTGTGDESTP